MHEIRVNDQLRLEKIKYSHAFQMFHAIDSNREFLSPWLPFVQQTQSQEDTEAFIRSILNQSGDRRDEVFVIWFNQRFAGLVGLKDTDYLNLKTEIGYWLVESMTGKGIMTKCVKNLVDFLFSVMKLNRIQIKCGVGNEKSSAIPKRLGFTFEGVERAGEKHENRFIDLEVYSLLKNECRPMNKL
ncbi:GNAT family N-acetyltransferase [Mangrovibacterium marinum]|uniref:Ribosomal-protein-serine acetyltransferase n=1 Tax=Mangrovibacterium marinum TaxID=1639118 RepID=A0A2T5BXI3_9BACT|nr:GNAT family protein [Mangrovibacterium marinum]PTN04816.1 ribosomal-protein-serine acetyltransferase [Mangrovibacterium marinum]